MTVRFVQVFDQENAFDYLEKKFLAVPGTGSAEAFELAIAARHTIEGKGVGIPLLGPAAVPACEERHRQVASEIADAMMPLLAGETLAQPDALDVLAADAAGFPKGTLLLRRTTNRAESLCFFPCTNVVDGVLYRGEAHSKSHEKVLATARNSVLMRDAAPDVFRAPSPANVSPIISSVASTIALSILGLVVNKVGSLAIDWALKQFGVGDPAAQAAIDYDQLVEALQLQSRADFRRTITAEIKGFDRMLGDYNNGMKTWGNLQRLYSEIIRITSYVEVSERAADRVHLLAFVQSQYLAIQQEMAEWYRQKGDMDHMKSYYKAMAKRASEEATILERVRKEAIDQRLDRITGLHHAGAIPRCYQKCWFEDVEPSSCGREWELYQIDCKRWVTPGQEDPVCAEWGPTTKGQGVVDTVKARMEGHRQWVYLKAVNALEPLPATIEHFRAIARMEIPPPEPHAD